MKSNREEIITGMCVTWRHDYNLVIDDTDWPDIISSGMTKIEREVLWLQMAQLFDNEIAPKMEFKDV